jgi:hypothetical protein
MDITTGCKQKLKENVTNYKRLTIKHFMLKLQGVGKQKKVAAEKKV